MIMSGNRYYGDSISRLGIERWLVLLEVDEQWVGDGDGDDVWRRMDSNFCLVDNTGCHVKLAGKYLCLNQEMVPWKYNVLCRRPAVDGWLRR